jgi:hypothetical protein
MTKVQHDLRHYQSFPDLNTRLRAFQSGNLLGKCRAQTNAREPVKSFRRVARLCFYRHNPFKFWTVLSDPEHPIRAYQIMTEFGAGRVFLARVRTALTREQRRGRSSCLVEKLTIFFIAWPTFRTPAADRSPFAIQGCNTAPTPTGFAKSVGNDFPVLHANPGSTLRSVVSAAS